MRARKRIGIIGFGALGKTLAAHLESMSNEVQLVGYINSNRSVSDEGRHVVSLEQLLEARPDVIVECAGQHVLSECGLNVVRAGVDLVPASIGVLVDDQFRRGLLAEAYATGATVRLPSGAIIGIDGLAAAHHGGIRDVLYRGTMPPATLKAHYKGNLPESGLVFSGSAREAVSLFPKNVNLTGTIAVAGLGFDDTRVEMIVDPTLTANVHELFVEGEFGEFHVQISGYRISASSPSSRIVAGSLAQAALGSNFTLLRE